MEAEKQCWHVLLFAFRHFRVVLCKLQTPVCVPKISRRADAISQKVLILSCNGNGIKAIYIAELI